MRTTFGPQILPVSLEVEGTGLDLFRIVRSDNPEDSAFLNSLRSNYELGRPPRRVETSAAVIHMGLSMYRTFEAAIGTAERWPKLGGYVARFLLLPDHGFNYAETGPRGHLTVWGDPVKLLDGFADVLEVFR